MARRLTALTAFGVFLAASSFAAAPEPGWISPKDLHALVVSKTPVEIFDARGKREFDEAHIAGAKLPLPLKYYNDLALFNAGVLPDHPDTRAFLRESLASLPKETKIVTYCNRGCKASSALREELELMGFKDVHAMEDGFEAWGESGYPVARSVDSAPTVG
jgi:rhodanese-related sulfurtransferase